MYILLTVTVLPGRVHHQQARRSCGRLWTTDRPTDRAARAIAGPTPLIRFRFGEAVAAVKKQKVVKKHTSPNREQRCASREVSRLGTAAALLGRPSSLCALRFAAYEQPRRRTTNNPSSCFSLPMTRSRTAPGRRRRRRSTMSWQNGPTAELPLPAPHLVTSPAQRGARAWCVCECVWYMYVCGMYVYVCMCVRVCGPESGRGNADVVEKGAGRIGHVPSTHNAHPA